MAIARQAFEQYFGVNNSLLIGGTIEYYEAVAGGSLSTKKSIYSNPAMTDAISNPQELNSLGTTDTAVIDQKIWDYEDDFDLGKVNYAPFLTEANPEAKPDPNAPIPTPAPEQTPTPELTPTPSQEPSQERQVETILGVAIVVAVIGVGLGLLIYLIKRK